MKNTKYHVESIKNPTAPSATARARVHSPCVKQRSRAKHAMQYPFHFPYIVCVLYPRAFARCLCFCVCHCCRCSLENIVHAQNRTIDGNRSTRNNNSNNKMHPSVCCICCCWWLLLLVLFVVVYCITNTRMCLNTSTASYSNFHLVRPISYSAQKHKNTMNPPREKKCMSKNNTKTEQTKYNNNNIIWNSIGAEEQQEPTRSI